MPTKPPGDFVGIYRSLRRRQKVYWSHALKVFSRQLSFVQSGKKNVDVPINYLNCRKLRENGRHPFVQLSLCCGQLPNALCKANAFVLLEVSNGRRKTVPRVRHCLENAADAGLLFV